MVLSFNIHNFFYLLDKFSLPSSILILISAADTSSSIQQLFSGANFFFFNSLLDLQSFLGQVCGVEEFLIIVVGSPWEVRASDSLIVKNDEPREALALLVTIVDLTNFVVLYSNLDDHHDILVDTVVDEVYPTNVH